MKGDPKKAPPLFVKGADGIVRLNTEAGWKIEAAPDLVSDELKELLEAEFVPTGR